MWEGGCSPALWHCNHQLISVGSISNEILVCMKRNPNEQLRRPLHGQPSTLWRHASLCWSAMMFSQSTDFLQLVEKICGPNSNLTWPPQGPPHIPPCVVAHAATMLDNFKSLSHHDHHHSHILITLLVSKFGITEYPWRQKIFLTSKFFLTSKICWRQKFFDVKNSKV